MGKQKDELKGSEGRLWRLIEARARSGADVAAIDRKIWDLFGEEWAIMFTDLSGFSRRVAEFGILHFLQVIFESHRIFLPIIEDHDGLLVKTEGDSLLLMFRRAEGALACARSMMSACSDYNIDQAPETRVLLCVGIGYGRVLRIGDHDVWGREVNAASKLGEDTARSGEILLTQAAVSSLGDTQLRFEDAGHSFEETDRVFRFVGP